MASEGPVVVTGATGFIGARVVAALAGGGRGVIAVSRSSPAAPLGVESVRVTSYRDTPCPKNATLIHLAGARSAGGGNSGDGNEVDLAGALASRSYAHVVFASSALVYGDRRAQPWREDDRAAGAGTYAQTKLECEAVVLAAGGGVARLANVYGPGMAKSAVLPDILRQIPGDGPIEVRDGAPVRDYLAVADAAAGVVALAAKGLPGVVNIGSGRGTSVLGLARLVLALSRQGARRVVSRAPPPNCPSHCVLDITKAMTQLRWRPRVDLAAGLAAGLEERTCRRA